MKISIIILHYGNIDTTIRCIKSVNLLHFSGILSIILINNDSSIKLTKSSLSLSGFSYPLTIVNSAFNQGFASGVNQGLVLSLKDKKTDAVLLLNNDTVVPNNLLSKLARAPFDIVAPVIKFKFGGQMVYDYGGVVNRWTGKTHHRELTDYPLEMVAKSIDYVSFCCVLINRKVFERIGFLDKQFFFYFEDVDYCLRATNAGFSVCVEPSVTIYHELSAAIGRWSREAIINNLKSNGLFIIKHLGWRVPVGLMYLSLLSLKIMINRIIKR